MKKLLSTKNFLLAAGLLLAIAASFIFPAGSLGILALVAPGLIADPQKKLQELRAAYKKAEDDMAAIYTKMDTEKRSTKTPEERTQWDALKKQASELLSEIADMEEMVKLDEKRAVAAGALPTDHSTPGKTDLGKGEVKNVRTAKVLNFLRASNPALKYSLEGVEKELTQDAAAEMRSLPDFNPGAGSYIPAKVLRHIAWTEEQYRDQEKRDIQATGSGLGLELVNTDTLASNYVQALRNQNVMMNAGCRVIPNDSGANVVFPRESSLYTAAMAATENAAASESLTATAFVASPLTFSPKRLTGFVQVSNQAFVQFPWWEAYLKEQITLGHATLLDTQAINGSGSSGQMRGVLNTSGTQTVVGGTNGLAFGRAHIVAFEQALGGAGANLANCRYITNFAVNAKGKNTEFSSGSGRYLIDNAPSWQWQNSKTGLNAQTLIDVYPGFLSNNVPSNLTKGTSTTICSAIIFGDVSKMVYMSFGGIQIIVDPYVNAQTALTNYVCHQYWDFNVILPTAVGFSADMLTT